MQRLDLEDVIRAGKLIEWMMQHGLLKEDVICDVCGEKMNKSIRNTSVDGIAFCCGKERCGRPVKSMRTGSIFWRYKQSLQTLMRFVYEWAEGTKLKRICRQLGVSKGAAVRFSDMLRHVVYREVRREMSAIKIGGAGKVVEIDETVVARRKYNVGRKIAEQWLFGGIVGGTLGGKVECFVELVNDRKAATL